MKWIWKSFPYLFITALTVFHILSFTWVHLIELIFWLNINRKKCKQTYLFLRRLINLIILLKMFHFFLVDWPLKTKFCFLFFNQNVKKTVWSNVMITISIKTKLPPIFVIWEFSIVLYYTFYLGQCVRVILKDILVTFRQSKKAKLQSYSRVCRDI